MSTASAAQVDASGTIQTPAEVNGSIARLGTTDNSTAAESESLSHRYIMTVAAANITVCEPFFYVSASFDFALPSKELQILRDLQ